MEPDAAVPPGAATAADDLPPEPKSIGRKILGNAITIGLFIAIVGGTFAGHLMAALQTPPDIIQSNSSDQFYNDVRNKQNTTIITTEPQSNTTPKQ